MPESISTRKETGILIFSVFIAGLCSIVYELLISTASSYFLGDSVKQFSLTIGLYMAAMGIGAYVSRHFKHKLLSTFVIVEILLGFLGGASVPILYFAYAAAPDAYYASMFMMILSIGFLIGLEIPLLTRIMEDYYSLKVNISNVLSLDYFGALIATLIFPFILLPFVGVFRSSLIFGIVNMFIGYMVLWGFRKTFAAKQHLSFVFFSLLAGAVLVALLVSSHHLTGIWSKSLYTDQVIFNKQTPYQQLVITRDREDIRLFINGGLQFSTIDEYRYHESLVHVPLAGRQNVRSVLLLGGGDGLAVRELLKHERIDSIVVVDLDPEMTNLARSNNWLRKINQNSLENPRVTVVNTDAFRYVKEGDRLFDMIIADLPDPGSISLARLYSLEFYQLIYRRLSPGGVFVTQATSPFFAGKAFWTIEATLSESKFNHVTPYHVYVPSFGDWGFIMASDKNQYSAQTLTGIQTRYLTPQTAQRAFLFEPDLRKSKDSAEVSTLDHPAVMTFYLKGWNYWK